MLTVLKLESLKNSWVNLQTITFKAMKIGTMTMMIKFKNRKMRTKKLKLFGDVLKSLNYLLHLTTVKNF